jgi:hypothetical protein
MSENSYKEEPSPVPEPTLPEGFISEEEHYRDFEEGVLAAKAQMGGGGFPEEVVSEDFVDRREETVAHVSPKLSREETPEREVLFKTTLKDYSPSEKVPPSAQEEEDEVDQGLPSEGEEGRGF